MNRRTFIEAMLSAGIVAPLGATVSARGSHATQAAKLRRMALSTFSLHNFFPNTRSKKAEVPEQSMTLPLAFEMVADRYRINQFEIHSPHLESLSRAYLDDIKSALRKHKCSITHISENGQNISQKDDAKRAASVEGCKRWVDAAKYLGARTIRIDSGRADYTPVDLNITIESYRQVAAYAKSQGVHATIENHFGVSADPDNIIKIVEAVGSDLTTSPDLGNFPQKVGEVTKNVVNYDALARLFKYAKHITSCKVFDFNESGEQPFDFARAMKIMNSSGFRGIVSLEYQGEKDPYLMLDKGLALTLQHLEA